jgi:AcrR family transcriptional regulator
MTESCAEKTFAATTIADIVGKASISRATFYKHFTNKRECFDAAADRALAGLRAAVEDAAGARAPRGRWPSARRSPPL